MEDERRLHKQTWENINKVSMNDRRVRTIVTLQYRSLIFQFVVSQVKKGVCIGKGKTHLNMNSLNGWIKQVYK